MRVRDYLRLGMANIAAHEGRVRKVVVITGVLFGVILMVSMLMQGIENTVIAEMLRPTEGKVLLGTGLYGDGCKEKGCDWEKAAEVIRAKIVQAGGEVVTTARYELDGAEWTALPLEVVRNGVQVDIAEMPEDAVPVLVEPRVAMSWLGINAPYTLTDEQQMKLAENLKERALGQTIELKSGEKVFVAGMVQGNVTRTNLSMTAAGQAGNPLNLVLGVVPVGSGGSFLIDTGDGRLERLLVEWDDVKVDEAMAEFWEKYPELKPDEATVSNERIWAVFPSLEAAKGYYYDEENYCEYASYANVPCHEEYKYRVSMAFGDVFEVEDVFEKVWIVIDVALAVLAGIGVIIMLTTYLRLVGQDTKVIALYRANGATKRQVLGIYMVYLMIMSLLAVVFAMGLGVVLTLMMNWWSGVGLTEAFTLAMGMIGQKIVLMGANKWLAIVAGMMILVAPVAVLMSAGQFSEKNLARKLK